jgi:integrase
MESQEAERFLLAAKEYCPSYYPLFLIALRAGLRQGEILALKWGDFQFGQGDSDPNRYILVGRRWHRGRVSTPKGNEARRVDVSRELRRVLIDLRDERMLEAFQSERPSISDDLFVSRRKGKPRQCSILGGKLLLALPGARRPDTIQVPLCGTRSAVC